VEKFKRSVLALAQPADVQSKLFANGVCKGDELALDFEEGLGELAEATVTAEQRVAIDALDKRILEMSGEANANFWLDETYLASHPAWEVIRSLARTCAATFEWKIEVPPPSGAVYITGHG